MKKHYNIGLGPSDCQIKEFMHTLNFKKKITHEVNFKELLHEF